MGSLNNHRRRVVNMSSIQKVKARVFCHLSGPGGNPVSVFYGTNFDSGKQREALAQSCLWESVFVSSAKLFFHMPTGEQVSFCAHAAMGSAFVRYKAGECDKTAAVVTADCGGQTGSTYGSIVHEEGDIVSLRMKSTWSETRVPNSPLLHRMLREFHGVKAKDAGDLPTLINSSIARPKTLVYVPDVSEVKVPPVHASYRQACDAIDSTGLYFFSDRSDEVGAWECRQFPRASGYPEDPATGIAAAALAVSLHSRHPRSNNRFKFFQGAAMGKPSLIVVDNISFDESTDPLPSFSEEDGDVTTGTSIHRLAEKRVSFEILGRVEIDSEETIHFDPIQ